MYVEACSYFDEMLLKVYVFKKMSIIEGFLWTLKLNGSLVHFMNIFYEQNISSRLL